MQPDNQPPSYDFILNPAPAPRRPLFGGVGTSKNKRIAVAAGGLVVLIILVIGVTSLLQSGSKGDINSLVDAALKQNELIRLSEIGLSKAHDQQARDLAVVTKLTLESGQAGLLAATKAQGRKLGSKELAAGREASTDTTLTNAEQSNRFDEVFVQLLNAKLAAYQKTVKAAYEGAPRKTKPLLATQFNSANVLAGVKQP